MIYVAMFVMHSQSLIVLFSVFIRWYQINITMRWEGEDRGSFGTPERVFQYEGKKILVFFVY